MKEKYNFIDIFAGCGGLSEGFYQEKFDAICHLDIDKWACETLKTRMKYYGYSNFGSRVLNLDITDELSIEKIKKIVNDRDVDVLVGGPPCQAYSTLGRAKDSKGMKNDPRNFLFENYVSILEEFKPKIFVFENVLGMLTAKVNSKKIVSEIVRELSRNYKLRDNLQNCILNSVNYGVPQIRKRVIIIGVRKDLNISVDDIYNNIVKTHNDLENNFPNLEEPITVKEAIYDLPKLLPGEGENILENFNYNISNRYTEIIGSEENKILQGHIARNHNDLDKKRYYHMAKEKLTFKEFLQQFPELAHERRRVFSNSYTVQFFDKPSRTIIAHLYKDGNQFIHPDFKQNRTLTPREAARLQSFPDDFIFEGSRTEQYKQIGNAVPPLMAKAIAKAIKIVLDNE